ncbi:hypothetical protein OAG25_03640, partial [Akkermansiaceae bacterium]|nr:hypothetical protein [Akkermansiaceae bacterium]
LLFFLPVATNAVLLQERFDHFVEAGGGCGICRKDRRKQDRNRQNPEGAYSCAVRLDGHVNAVVEEGRWFSVSSFKWD